MVWKECETIFSNGTEFEIFSWQCERCTRFRNEKCRIYNKILDAMYDSSKFPYSDLMDATGGYCGKKCKSFTDKPIIRRRKSQDIDGQMAFELKC